MENPKHTDTGLHDELLDKMVGEWRITRDFGKRVVENDVTISWQLCHRYILIDMIDVEIPPAYAAHVYIGFENPDQRYVIYWLDITAGSQRGTIGYGHRDGNAIVMEWKDGDGTLMNTFTWDPIEDTWTSKIEQTGPDGMWETFCVDTYRRV